MPHHTTMQQPRRRGKAIWGLFSCLLCLAPGASPALASAALQPAAYDGAASCKDCHTVPTVERGASLPFVMLTEYSIWKTQDKHAQAYAVLKGELGQQMGRLLKADVLDPKTGCLNCHAMNSLAQGGAEQFNPTDGVSCGGCHGPSEKWLEAHKNPAWRKKTPQEKAELGMTDLRNPHTRADLCMSCHVGNATQGKVVTHPMFAAGHPPLPPIEVASFSKNEPQHWRDPRDVPFLAILREVAELKETDMMLRSQAVEAILKKYRKTNEISRQEINQFLQLYPNAEEARKTLANYPHGEDYRTGIALAGSLGAMKATVKLAEDRANFTGTARPDWVWPEFGGNKPSPAELTARWPELAMAHSDCFSCHHDLEYPGIRQKRGFGLRLPGGELLRAIPGRPMIRMWPLVLMGAATHQAFPEPDAYKKHLAELRDILKVLVDDLNKRPFGDPKAVATQTKLVREWVEKTSEALSKSKLTRDNVVSLLRTLGEQPGLEYLDYESAKQVAALVLVAWDDLGIKDDKAKEPLQWLTANLNLKPYSEREERQKLIQEVVNKLAGNKEAADMSKLLDLVKDPSNAELLLTLRNDKFLNALRNDISNDRMNEFLEMDVVGKLQDINNKELDKVLVQVQSFNPAEFQSQMKKLVALLPKQ